MEKESKPPVYPTADNTEKSLLSFLGLPGTTGTSSISIETSTKINSADDKADSCNSQLFRLVPNRCLLYIYTERTRIPERMADINGVLR